MNIENEREAFEKKQHVKIWNWFYYDESTGKYKMKIVTTNMDKFVALNELNYGWSMWQASALHAEEKLEGCVVVPKSEITNWYLDEDESIYIDEPDSFLCDLEPGDVLEVKRQQCWTVENQFAAKVYTDEDNIFWEFFDSEKEAEKAAAHCKAMLEAARSGNE
ncbi:MULTISPECIES: hypothetical protein [Acinetobacter]|uniref:Uncharacterized protein n=1 Tax=Acinetobacter higginsii TaxID=70347 RepID=N9SX66_9GAMM|nr:MULTISPECIES: hypothetical protein [Acinetobacter]ENX55730.1 hypothetical protein F902_03289 [Acinetobacter higginsii]